MNDAFSARVDALLNSIQFQSREEEAEKITKGSGKDGENDASGGG